MTSEYLPTDVLLLRVQCSEGEVPLIAHDLAKSPICIRLGAELCRSAWSATASIAYMYLRLSRRLALSQEELGPIPDLVSSTVSLRVARLSLMQDIPGASRGQKATVHYSVEMTPEKSWEIELQRWYDTEHLPGLAQTPGCVSAQRYWNHDEGPRSLACYDLVSQEVVGSAAWLAVRNTEWSSRMRPRFTDTIRTSFSLQG